MSGWIHQVVRMATIRNIFLQLGILFYGLAFAGQFALPGFHDVVITNGIENRCEGCTVRSCVVQSDTPSIPPIFYEREADTLESISAVFAALSFVRYELSDEINYSAKNSFPPDLFSVAKSRPSYIVGGVSLTNLFVRTFTFASSPSFSMTELRYTLVSFFFFQSYIPETHFFSLYVNNMTGRVGLSIQECSLFMRFLSNSPTQYPFLGEKEVKKQIEFCSRINQRRFPFDNWMVKPLPVEIGTNSILQGNSEVSVEVGDL